MFVTESCAVIGVIDLLFGRAQADDDQLSDNASNFVLQCFSLYASMLLTLCFNAYQNRTTDPI